ncbi:galanin receptor type 1 [Exaiptasia diaphana]|uniref:G-protein coupled receptors family 1 profile domain-containing protein n=1 Tax=Exaiptasia diaphana TaxID=2652724 RepID=A0A913Y6T0_EXADI|nr:galanin receptor type 1 [Exaiptasia diaphana]
MSSNSLIISLAAADLGILLVYVPFYVAYEMLGLIWPFGEVLCKFVFSSTHICLYASLGTLVGVAIERYLVAFDFRVSKPKIIMGLISVWIVSLALSIPQMINLQLVKIDVEEFHADVEYVCELVWPDPMYERVLHPVDFVLFYLLPLMIISVLYVKISVMLRSAIKHSAPKRRFARQVQKAVYVLIVVVCVFGICNLPIYVLHLYRVFWSDHWLGVIDKNHWLFSVCAALYLLPHSANPIIYAILDRKFRKEALTVLKKCKPLSMPCKPWRFPCHKGREESPSEIPLELLPQSLPLNGQEEEQHLSGTRL